MMTIQTHSHTNDDNMYQSVILSHKQKRNNYRMLKCDMMAYSKMINGLLVDNM